MTVPRRGKKQAERARILVVKPRDNPLCMNHGARLRTLFDSPDALSIDGLPACRGATMSHDIERPTPEYGGLHRVHTYVLFVRTPLPSGWVFAPAPWRSSRFAKDTLL